MIKKKKVVSKKTVTKASPKKKVINKKITTTSANKTSIKKKTDVKDKFNPFFNRDISWLDFNARVLNEAVDKRTPLLERLRFMSIWRSNNDEFYMKRIGALHRANNSTDIRSFVNTYKSQKLLVDMREKVEQQQILLNNTFLKEIVPSLKKEKIKFTTWKELSQSDRNILLDYFKQNVFPILTPLAVDSGHPFPFISNLSKSIGVKLRKPGEQTQHFARLKVPTELPQWIRLDARGSYQFRFINIEELIINNISILFSGMHIESSCLFRVTRNASINEEGDDAEDKLEWVEEGLKERKFAPVVRLEIMKGCDNWIRQFLME